MCGNWSSPTFFCSFNFFFLCVCVCGRGDNIYGNLRPRRRREKRNETVLSRTGIAQGFFLTRVERKQFPDRRANVWGSFSSSSTSPTFFFLPFFLSLSLSLSSFLPLCGLCRWGLLAFQALDGVYRYDTHKEPKLLLLLLWSLAWGGGWRGYIKSEKSNQSNIDLVLPADKKKPKRLSLVCFLQERKIKVKGDNGNEGEVRRDMEEREREKRGRLNVIVFR